MRKNVCIFNILLILAVLVGDVFYIITDSVLVKSITSAGFFVIGIINLIYALKDGLKNKKFAIIMLVGLFFAMLGDIILEFNFIVGAGLFAIGHVFYFIAYCFLINFQWKDLLYGVAIFIPATLCILFLPIFNFENSLMQVVCIVYAIIIACMVGKSISNYVQQKNLLNLLIMIGSILFMFSDLMLLVNKFASISHIFGILCLATYYPAECLLAFSIKKTVE